MCQYQTEWTDDELYFLKPTLVRLQELVTDGLISIDNNKIEVREMGKPFIRNICMAFDERLWARKPSSQLFSQVV